MKSAAIIGAGITGLTAAFYLKRAGAPVAVYEAGGRAGGAMGSRRQDGFLAEFGPNTILETSPKVSQLVNDLNLAARRIYPDPNAQKRFLVREGRLVAMPSSPAGFLTTKLFSFPAKLAVLREPFIRPRRDGAEESVAEFVTRRLNREFLERAINPLVAGIYAGDPQKLSVKHAFPALYELEQRHGSLIRGQIFGARERKQRGEISRRAAKSFSFDEGLQVFTDALAQSLGDALHLNCPVKKIRQSAGGWTVQANEGGREISVEHGAVIYCGTAHRLAELGIEAAPAVDLSSFAEIRHPPVASVVLGFRREAVAHPLDGFGVLVPQVENLNILGTIFSSSLFPNRAPAGRVTLTSYVGGERQPELAGLSPEKLVELVLADLRVLLGVSGRPEFQHVTHHPRAIPQYNVGYGGFKESLDRIEAGTPGLFFAGNYRHGVALGDSIGSGSDAAKRVAQFVGSASTRLCS